MKTTHTILLLALFACSVTYVSSQAQGPDKQGSSDSRSGSMSMGSASAKAAGKLTKVEDHKKICMVTNKAFAKDQIPIEIEGRTYYGCCEMCKTALSTDPGKRTAVDPVSNEKVDKSVAVIGVDSNGRVLYFENDKNFAAYNSKIGQ